MQRSLLGIGRWAVGIYYRVSSLGGTVPDRGPVLLVANHPNGLVDPILLSGTTTRVVRFLGKATLFDVPVFGRLMRGIDALPVYRSQDGADTSLNQATFAAVHRSLLAGELVCLFPEGKSHDEPALAKLKTGAARMALGAQELAEHALGLAIVPVGLVYRSKRRFRSSVATWIGPAIPCADLADLQRSDEREAVRILTERISAGLRAVTLDLERWEQLPLLDLAERIDAAEHPDERGRVARLGAFAAGVRALRAEDPDAIDALTGRIVAFQGRLQRLGLAPEDLSARLERRYEPGVVAAFVLKGVAMLAVGFPLAALGTIFWYVPYRLAALLPRPFTRSDSVVVTGRILAAIVIFPLWLVLALVGIARATSPSLALVTLLVAPILGFIALAFRDWRESAWAEILVFLRLGSRTGLRMHLLREREELAGSIEALRSRLRSAEKKMTGA